MSERIVTPVSYDSVRKVITDAYYGARNSGFTMEQAADDAAGGVIALIEQAAKA